MTEEVLTGRDIFIPTPEELISDADIRQILARFTPILYQGIADAGTFFSRSFGGKLANAVFMDEDELGLWDGLFSLQARVLEEAKHGNLYVPDVPVGDIDLLACATSESSVGTDCTRAITTQEKAEGTFRVNLDERVYVPIQPFDPEDFKLLLRPQAHLGGSGLAPGHLYNAFIDFNVYVQDKLGRWVIDQVSGTGVMPWMGGPVYSPFCVASSDLWFNTSIESQEQNSLSISVDKPYFLMLSGQIHHPEQLSQLEVPDDVRLKHYFWQLQRFMRPLSFEEGENRLLLSSSQ